MIACALLRQDAAGIRIQQGEPSHTGHYSRHASRREKLSDIFDWSRSEAATIPCHSCSGAFPRRSWMSYQVHARRASLTTTLIAYHRPTEVLRVLDDGSDGRDNVIKVDGSIRPQKCRYRNEVMRCSSQIFWAVGKRDLRNLCEFWLKL